MGNMLSDKPETLKIAEEKQEEAVEFYTTAGEKLLTAADLIDAYIQHILSEKRYSPNTALAYRRDLDQFFAFLSRHIGEALTIETLSHVEETDLRAYLTHNHMSGEKTRTTLNRQLSSVRTFYKWLNHKGILENSRIKLVKNMKVGETKPRPLSTQDAWDFIEKFKKTGKDNLTNRRNYAMMVALYGLGLRLGELLAMNREDVQAEQILIHGKGGKDRLLPMPEFIRKPLIELLELMPERKSTGEPLFTNPRGHRLSARTVQKVVAEIRFKMGMPDTVTPHALRHSFASHLLASGAELRSVQTLLGHTSLDTTQRYLDADFTRVLDIHKKKHPMNKKG